MDKVKYLVIGAGITGLGFAAFRNSKDYAILEKEDSAGGYCRTFYSGEYVWDYAGHFFHFRTPEMRSFFENAVDRGKIVHKSKNTKIMYKDKFIDYPFQMNIHQLSKDEFIQCLYDLNNRSEKESYTDFLDMLYGKFGNGIVEKFLKPYNEKLYACDLKELDKDAMGRFFPYADMNQIINNMRENSASTYNDDFSYHEQGAAAFVDALLGQVDIGRISFYEGLERLDLKNKVAITEKREIHYEYLINTSPFDGFLRIAEPLAYRKAKTFLNANKVLVFNIGFDGAPDDKSIHWIYFPEKKYVFYRVGFYNNILSKEKMSIYVEIGFRRDEEVDISFMYQKTLRDLKDAGIITRQRVVDFNYIIMDPAYVHINLQGMKIVKDCKARWKDENVYSIGRYGSWIYCSIEDCLLEAKNLADALKDEKD